jgi:anti-anti-sigma regulatory factor
MAVPVRLGEHACCHFLEADDRRRLAVAFVRDRLRRGHRVVYFSGDDAGVAPGTWLAELDPSFEPAIARGQLEVRRARDAYLPGDRFEPDRMLEQLRQEIDRARADGYRGLDVTGEVPVEICDLPGGEQLGAYEAGIAGRSGDLSYSVLCQYDHRRLGAGLLSTVLDAHEVDSPPELAMIGREGELSAAVDRTRGALRLAGELDFAGAETVSAALEEHFSGPLRLDLADLTYVDVAGMRALRGGDGRRLTIGPASRAVRRLIPLLGWDTDPEIELLEED